MNYYVNKERPFPGNWDQQPIFFNEMINALTQKEQEIIKTANKRGKDGRRT